MRISAWISAFAFGCYSCQAFTIRVPYLIPLSHPNPTEFDLYPHMWSGAMMAKNDFNARNSSTLEAFASISSKCPKYVCVEMFCAAAGRVDLHLLLAWRQSLRLEIDPYDTKDSASGAINGYLNTSDVCTGTPSADTPVVAIGAYYSSQSRPLGKP